jgi:hypothetical protein
MTKTLGESSMKTKLFTLTEANGLLPQLELLLTRVEKKRLRCEQMHDVFFVRELIAEALPADKEARGLDEEAQQLDDLVHEIEEDVELLRRTGCRFRNLERGCIDFPGRYAAREVFFCWVRGEKTIGFYHSHEDPAARLSLE